MALTVENIKASLENGLLSFPITDMKDNGEIDANNFAKRVDWFVSKKVSSVFVAGGTGEFFSLSKSEYQALLESSVETIGDRVPLISSIGRSIPEAIEFAAIAEKAGAHALLLMPPYLTDCPQDGLVAYTKNILQNTSLPVIYYNRANGMLGTDAIQEIADTCPNLIAIKDGTSNMQDLNILIKTLGKRLSYIGGAPTAEIISEAYLSVGVNTYSSAVFNFVPDLANYFYKSLRAGDSKAVKKLTNVFFAPFVKLRDRKKGYAVSLIKAGATFMGRSAGEVRAPLVMPNRSEIQELEKIIEKGLLTLNSLQ